MWASPLAHSLLLSLSDSEILFLMPLAFFPCEEKYALTSGVSSLCDIGHFVRGPKDDEGNDFPIKFPAPDDGFGSRDRITLHVGHELADLSIDELSGFRHMFAPEQGLRKLHALETVWGCVMREEFFHFVDFRCFVVWFFHRFVFVDPALCRLQAPTIVEDNRSLSAYPMALLLRL